MASSSSSESLRPLGPKSLTPLSSASSASLNGGVSLSADRAVEASLGYYIYPLVSALLGVVLFGEALRGLQAVAIGLAALAVACLTWGLGVAPMVALALAVSFACYSAAKKRIAGSAMISVLVEVLIIAPPLVAPAPITV